MLIYATMNGYFVVPAYFQFRFAWCSFLGTFFFFAFCRNVTPRQDFWTAFLADIFRQKSVYENAKEANECINSNAGGGHEE